MIFIVLMTVWDGDVVAWCSVAFSSFPVQLNSNGLRWHGDYEEKKNGQSMKAEHNNRNRKIERYAVLRQAAAQRRPK